MKITKNAPPTTWPRLYLFSDAIVLVAHSPSTTGDGNDYEVTELATGKSWRSKLEKTDGYEPMPSAYSVTLTND